ncbi:ABC transporter substrate-binding protein [Solibacillus silvestris]|uniref:ABC transporter substrate-binding protein n=1 Tax=Solibacillus silvestris TaxID=76853 RepID=UPI003F81F41F
MLYELTLYKHFEQNSKTKTTIEELATIWQCSTRHAKNQIQLLDKCGVVHWETLRGRGKKPSITLLRNKIDVLVDVMQKLWAKGKYEETMRLAEQLSLLTHPQIRQWLNVRFGLQVEHNLHIFKQPMYFVELCLDPLRALSRHDMHIIEQIHESLFIIGEDGQPKENLVFHSSTKDFQHWQFILRKGILFHNLQEVTAADVVVSLRKAAPFYKLSFEFEKLAEIDRYEIHVTLNKPFTLLPHFLASARFAIMPLDRKENIGCGPFSLLEHNDERMKLQTFPQYFKARPWIDLVEIVYTDHFQNEWIRYEPFPAHIPSLKIINQEIGAEYVALNSHSPVLADERTRAAIWHAITPEQFIEEHSNEIVAYSWLLNGEQLIFKQAEPIPISIPPLVIGYQQIRKGVNHEREALILQRQLSEAGIQASLKCINFNEPHNKLNEEIDLFVGGIALGKNILLSLLSIYLSEPSILLSFLSTDDKKAVLQKLQSLSEQYVKLDAFKEIEIYMQSTYNLKFLSHRQHNFYIREGTPYKHVQFDHNGRLDYRSMYLLNENIEVN